MAKNTPNEMENVGINMIANGTIIKGDVKTNGDIRIDGTLTGTIDCKGKIVVGPTGVVEGEIMCQNGVFSGSIKAKVTVSELLTLQATARLLGDIITNKLAIEPGAKFTGHCSMHDASAFKDNRVFDNKSANPQTQAQPQAQQPQGNKFKEKAYETA